MTRSSQTRRRGPALEQAILDAAWAELGETGWSHFTIAGVARRCGTAKNVIYRRWQDRVDLARAMLVRALQAQDQTPQSLGDLKADLVEFLEGLKNFYAGPFGDAIRGVLSEHRGPVGSVMGPAVPAPISAIIDAALARGELTRRPPPLAQNVGHAIMTHELIHTSEPLTAAQIEDLVSIVWLPALHRH